MNGKPSSPVLRGLGASDGAQLLDSNGANRVCRDYFRLARNPTRIDARRGDPSYKLAYQALGGVSHVSVLQHSLKRSLLEAMK